jgi:hypothetical protein
MLKWHSIFFLNGAVILYALLTLSTGPLWQWETEILRICNVMHHYFSFFVSGCESISDSKSGPGSICLSFSVELTLDHFIDFGIRLPIEVGKKKSDFREVTTIFFSYGISDVMCTSISSSSSEQSGFKPGSKSELESTHSIRCGFSAQFISH